MRTLLVCLSLFLITLACRKEKQDEICMDGTIVWAGDPALDGAGWVLKSTAETPQTYVLKSLPEEYKTDGLAVNACIYETKEPAICMCGKTYYKIVSIRKR